MVAARALRCTPDSLVPPPPLPPPPAGRCVRACSPSACQAYRRLALIKHPDKNPDNPKAADEFQALQRAYDLLCDKEARAALDNLLK